jgi:hypothetical protein
MVEDDDLHDIKKIYSGRGKFWVAIDVDRIVGTIGAREYIGDTAKLRRMFVQKEYRGTELAKKQSSFMWSFCSRVG